MRVTIEQTNPVTQDFAVYGGNRLQSFVVQEPEVEIVINTSSVEEAREIVRRLQGMPGFPNFTSDEADQMARALSKLDRNFPRRLDIE